MIRRTWDWVLKPRYSALHMFTVGVVLRGAIFVLHIRPYPLS